MGGLQFERGFLDAVQLMHIRQPGRIHLKPNGHPMNSAVTVEEYCRHWSFCGGKEATASRSSMP